ncbi:hypothetical protein RND81_12G138100 [Saponaria officinalis]|uniref:F-box domain-containing protein n=1 Tax=Saponaria officinalis TaxID=3572 RepID=A0AAW1HAA3_SAPOF
MESSSFVRKRVVLRIPDEIIHYEILTRVPVRSLLRFKSVCKDWYTLINSSTFINAYEKYAFDLSTHDSRDFLSVATKFTTDYPKKQLIFTYYDAPQFTSGIDVIVDKLININDDYPTVVVGSCNGLICLRMHQSGLLLCNPITRECRRLSDPVSYDGPDVTTYYEQYGFGYDIVSNNYKIVKITSIFDEFRLEKAIVLVYNAYNNSWKEARNIPRSAKVSPSQYWSASRLHHYTKQIIITFDLHTEEFKVMKYPTVFKGYTYHLLQLMITGGRLCAIVSHRPYSNFTLWVMKEYGMPKSWTKLSDIDERISYFSVITYRTRTQGEELLFKKYVDNQLVWYNIEDKSITKVDVTTNDRIYSRQWVCIASLARIPANVAI